ncbi:Bestrophin, RFP-TM, chloride channel-domain-containing protein [Gautieria morchelliformis]|nr:Bestrophin, RFP-TM, chloride channel-domain-containing protein [Gautieria morchelliformis]
MTYSSFLTARWSVKKFNATVIDDIWPETLLFTLIATMVAAVTEMTRHKLQVNNALLTVLGTVLGLVISFRTSSAYERYQEGRKYWTNIQTYSRTLAQLLWVYVEIERPDKNYGENAEVQRRAEKLKAIVEKRSMINLIQAFSVAVKHFLRNEPGIYYEDLYPLISFLPRHTVDSSSEATAHDFLPIWTGHEKLSQSARTTPTVSPANTIRTKRQNRRNDSFDPEKALPRVTSDVPLRGARNPPKPTVFDYFPILMIVRPFMIAPMWLYHRIVRKREVYSSEPDGMDGPPVDSNIPLEITMFLHSYLQYLQKKAYVSAGVASGLLGNLGSLQDTVTNLERVRNTPIPFAYQAHLRISLWLYLALLPFQIVQAMGWFTIPATCFGSFLLLGFLQIGQEIENPFNYDENDLDMDSFCLGIQRELHEITAHPVLEPQSYIFSAANQPFAPGDCRGAEEIVSDVTHDYHGPTQGMHTIRRTLLKSWRQVEQVTREV